MRLQIRWLCVDLAHAALHGLTLRQAIAEMGAMYVWL